MGLDTTHNAWHGSYGGFMNWRTAIAKAAGLPPLCLMAGFYRPGEYPDLEAKARDQGHSLPISWESQSIGPLEILLNHSDCDGELLAADCPAIADALEVLLPKLSNQYDIKKAEQFIAGLRFAASRGEDIEFH